MSSARCPAAHPDDRRPCDGPPDTVEVTDRNRGHKQGCVLHAAVLLAGLDSRACVSVLSGPANAAIRCEVASLREPQDDVATIAAAMKRVLGRSVGSYALMTPGEVALLMRVDPKTVTRWARTGLLTSIRTIGGHRRYYANEVRALMKQSGGGRSK